MQGESLKRKDLPHKEKLKQFIEHCCTSRQYFFNIRKCGTSTCDSCKPPSFPENVLSSLHIQVSGTTTTEAHCPSLQKKSKRTKTLPFESKLRHVKNVNMMLECEHCGLWRLLYSQQKLTKKEREAPSRFGAAWKVGKCVHS